MKNKKHFIRVIPFLVISIIICLFCRSTAIYSYGPAPGDFQQGWPLVYGYDQNDVWGEMFFIDDFHSFTSLFVDIVVGFLLGLFVYYVTWKIVLEVRRRKLKLKSSTR